MLFGMYTTDNLETRTMSVYKIYEEKQRLDRAKNNYYIFLGYNLLR